VRDPAAISVEEIADRLETHCESFAEAVDLAKTLTYADTPELTRLLEEIQSISYDAEQFVWRAEFLDTLSGEFQ